MREVTRVTLEVLVLIGALSGLALVAVLVASLVLATFRVAVRGRVLVLPFAGSDVRRVELTDLFVRRLTEVEQEWIRLANAIARTRQDVNRDLNVGSNELTAVANRSATPLVDGATFPTSNLPVMEPGAPRAASVGGSPRTSGDELLPHVIQLERVGAIGNADLGVISIAGASFSPHALLTLLRAAPGLVARRTMRGSIIGVPGGSLVCAEFEERGLGYRRNKSHIVEVRDEGWLVGLEDLAFGLAKQRVYLVGEKQKRWPELRGRRASRPEQMKAGFHGSDRLSGRSETVRSAIIEATSWPACRVFLQGYAAHLRHYRYGRAADREEAMHSYEEALVCQPGFPRAAYNRATLLYNQYLPSANDQAIEGFSLATSSRDPVLLPLAFAGLAMAHCQAIQRFGRTNQADHKRAARDAVQTAVELQPELEEVALAKAWVSQIDGEFEEAIHQYETVVGLSGTSAPARRIKSFALNNAAYIWLTELGTRTNAVREAESMLWTALALYPNKVAYANLAEIARRLERRTDAVKFFEHALALDPSYANCLNECAVVEAELAAIALGDGQQEEATRWISMARAHAESAQRLLVADPQFAGTLEQQFREAELAYTVAL